MLSHMPRLPAPPALHEPLGVVFGARGRVAALRVLHWAGTPLTGREVARRARLSTRGAQDALTDLEAAGIVQAIAGGRDRLVQPNRRHALWPSLAACFRDEAALYPELRSAIAAALRPVPGVLSAVLFGSVARREERSHSDCDVLVVARTASAASAALEVVVAQVHDWQARYGIRVAPVAWGLAAARKAAAAGEAPWVNAKRDAITLVGRPLAEVLTP